MTLLSVAFLLLSGGSGELTAALEQVTAADLRATVELLAADEFEGRCAGEPGNDRAAEHLAAQLSELGLEAVGDDGTYFQRFEFSVRGGRGRKAATRNVLGLLRGSDPEVGSEAVVIGGHFDHVGTLDSANAGRIGGAKGADTIWNGADDNASGTATVLQVARAFVLGGLEPRRSVLFVFFSAEEQGLYGSAWYAGHPVVPLERTVAMLNLDMVGRNPDQPLTVMALGSAEDRAWYALVEAARAATPQLPLNLVGHSQPDSDHHSFVAARVPAAFLFSGLHTDYHRVTDHADKVAYERMADVGRFATALALEVADTDLPLRFRSPVFEGRTGKELGIDFDAVLGGADMAALGRPDQGGVRVARVHAGSVAEKAGLLPGDVILAVRSRPLSPDEPDVTLRRAVGAAPSGQDVPIVVLREGEEVTLAARW